MLDRARSILILVLAAVGAAASAATVSFLVFETGLREDAPQAEASLVWETGVMDVFFEEGHIVSNSGLSRLDKTGLPPAGTGLKEALDGGADLYIQLSLDYRSTAKAFRLSPDAVSCRICDTAGRTIYQVENAAQSPTIKDADEVKKARDFARVLVGKVKDRKR